MEHLWVKQWTGDSHVAFLGCWLICLLSNGWILEQCLFQPEKLRKINPEDVWETMWNELHVEFILNLRDFHFPHLVLGKVPEL